MPVTRSALKALRVSIRRRKENLKVERTLKQALKHVSKEKVSRAFSAIDKAVKLGVLHPNKADRLKSRLARRFGSPAAAGPKVSPKSKSTSRKKVRR